MTGRNPIDRNPIDRRPSKARRRARIERRALVEASEAALETSAGELAQTSLSGTRPSWGWLVVARKELADHLLSARSLVLLIVLALAVAIPLYFAADQIRSLAPQASGTPAVFLALFTLGSQSISVLKVDQFVAIVAPLLGIAFGFDAVNRERSERTLARLVAQPIHRDDVINGKFAAGLAMIAIVLVAMTLLIAGFGMFRLGIVPASSEVIRIIAWLLATMIYVALWLALGTFLSVVVRRAATSALIGFGLWLVITIFGSLITSLVGGFIANASNAATTAQALQSLQVQQFVNRLMPSTIYQEISAVILHPDLTQISVPVTVGQLDQANQQIPSLLSLSQSLLLVWPHLVALVALTAALFAAAYVRFLRQEIRA